MTSPASGTDSVSAAGFDPRLAAIRCDRVSYRYPNGVWASRDVDLALRPGEVYCLLGPNGAGKTSLLLQIVGDLEPTSGQITIFGRDVSRERGAAKRLLGIIPQEVGLFAPLTVAQHLRHFAALKGVPRESHAATIRRVTEECALGPLLGRRALELSLGQRRRVLVALALLGEPPVLVLDEPTVGLDPLARRELWTTVRRQAAQGRAVLLTTHYLDEAEVLADRLGLLEAGRIVHTGTVAELCATLGSAFKVSELDEATGNSRTERFFDTLEDARRFVTDNQIRSFLVRRVSLEDAYVNLYGSSPSPRLEGTFT